MKKYAKYRAGVTLFFSALLIVGILNAVWPKPTYSTIEKRPLAAFPEFSFSALASGEFISGVQKYMSDTFIGREGLFSLAAQIKGLYGIKGDSIIIEAPSGDQGKVQDTSSASASSEGTSSSGTSEPSTSSDITSSAAGVSSEAASSQSAASRDEGGQVVNNLVVGSSTVFQMYQYYEKVNTRYASCINTFADKYTDVNTYCMVVPINTAFYLPEKYINNTSDEQESIQKIYAALNSKVTAVDAFSKLAQHTNEYIYFRSDHHWTQLGAYYGYSAFAEATGAAPFSLSGLRTIEYTGFLGSLYTNVKSNAAAAALLEKNPDTVTAYIPDFDYTLHYYPKESITKPASYLGKGTLVSENCTNSNKYMCFIHGDQPMEVIENHDNLNGKTLIIFKESYGNAFTPLVCHDYQTTIVVDFRYFQGSLAELMSLYDVTDALFLDYILAPGTSERVNELQSMVNG